MSADEMLKLKLGDLLISRMWEGMVVMSLGGRTAITLRGPTKRRPELLWAEVGYTHSHWSFWEWERWEPTDVPAR